MLNFIIGEKGSGKTAAAHRIIGQCAEKGESVMLIVPRQFSFESDKSILSLLGPRLASEIEVLSFKRLCDEGIRRYGTKNKPVAKSGKPATSRGKTAGRSDERRGSENRAAADKPKRKAGWAKPKPKKNARPVKKGGKKK